MEASLPPFPSLPLPPSPSPHSLSPATPAIGPLSSTQLDYSDAAVTATLIRAGPRPAAESAHNMTLQFTNYTKPLMVLYLIE